MQKIFSFNPIIGEQPELLILGTAPSVQSLERRQFYGHPRNHFWPVICALLGLSLPDSYDQRTALLRNSGIALWDVAHSCIRPGSLDTNIRETEPNDIPSLLQTHPTIRTVAFNGQTAQKLYDRFFPRFPDLLYLRLPSSSPIPTAACRNLADKLEAWRALTPFLPHRNLE